MNANELLPVHLEACVPLRIAEIQAAGGVTPADFARVQEYATLLGAYGDSILYRTRRTAEMITVLTDAVAVLAFVPGGITVFGLHFEAGDQQGVKI